MRKNKKLSIILFVILILALPLLLLGIKQTLDNRSRAAAADKLETENGVLSASGVIEQSDSQASGGKYIVFSNPPYCTPININTSSAISDGGFAWVIGANLGNADNSSFPTQSNLKLYENGVEIGPAHSPHADIRNIGQGRFSHWSSTDGTGESIRFSAKDNSDPRNNGKTYSYCAGSSSPTLTQASSPTPTSQISGGTIFYVSTTGSDTNPGTQTSPWRTIQKAANTLTAGQTAIIKDGVYREPGIDFNKYDGTRSNPITIKAENKWGAVLESTSAQDCEPSISISKSWITIDGIRFTTSGTNGCTSPSSANGAARCWATNPYPHPDNPSTGTEGCTFRNVKVDPSTVKHVGIKTNQDYSLIENSEIHNSIEPFGNTGTVIRNNKVFGTDVWGSSIFGKGGVRNMQVYGNVVKNGSGILLGGDGWTAPAPGTYDFDNPAIAYNSVAYNNVIINDNPNTGNGIGMAGAENSAIYNNVIIGGGLFLWSGYSNRDLKTENPKIQNNIVVCNGVGATSGASGWEWIGTAVIDYNLFYNCSGGVPTQAHPITGNPNFVNPASDWHLQPGSPGIGSGTQVTMQGYDGTTIEVNKNFDGLLRFIAWNLGIY